MTLVQKLVILSCFVPSAVFAAETATLCKANETNYFSCKIKNSSKTVSLCGSDESKTGPWLQYRFGTVSKLELVYPTTKNGSLKKFEGESHHSAEGGDNTISFINGGVRYSVVYLDADSTFYGVWVARSAHDSVEFPCEEKPDLSAFFPLESNLE
ncbi:MAG: hypothetical protein ACRETM_14055 [Stenotrophobium sp.]